MILRTAPPVCLLISLARFLTGALGFNRLYVGMVIQGDENRSFSVFRHVRSNRSTDGENGAVLLVRFRFRSLPDCINRVVSLVPMLLITGFPGFRAKMYGVCQADRFWMGMYEWKSVQALEKYKQSFVLKMMNRRAATGSVSYRVLPKMRLMEFVEENLIEPGGTR